MELFKVLHEDIYDFILIFARMSAMIAFAPVFGAKSVPDSVKAILAFVFSVIFTIFLPPLVVDEEKNTAGLILQLAGEATVGAAIGFAATFIFEIIIFAGYIIDYMIGFGFINVVDPQSGTSVSVFAFFYSFLTLILFLMVDAHHVLIEIMARSYELIPLFSLSLTPYSIEQVVRMIGAIFYVGFQLSAPIFIFMFVIDLSMGLISKTVPQLQIMVVGFPVKIGVGLLTMGAILQPMSMFIIELIHGFRQDLLWMLKYLGGVP